MYKEIKRQIEQHTRKELDHVYVPETRGLNFKSDSRVSIVSIPLRYQSKSFTLKRQDGFSPTVPEFEAFGGDFSYQIITSSSDGSLSDSNIPQYGNVLYTTKFLPNKDILANFPFSISADSALSVYWYYGTEPSSPSFVAASQNGEISIPLRNNEAITIVVCYYNKAGVDSGDGSGGKIKIFDGIAEYVSSWSYIDVTPPDAPTWHTTPLTTEAAQPGAGTTKVTLKFQAPVVATEDWESLPPSDRRGVLTVPDLAGHNIYRVVSYQLFSGSPVASSNGTQIINPIVSDNTISIPGSSLSQYVRGAEVTVTGTEIFLAKFNDSTTDELGRTATMSGAPRFRQWAKLGVDTYSECLTNSDFNTNSWDGYTPSGWTSTGINSATGTAILSKLTNTGDFAVVMNKTNEIGTFRLYQDYTAIPSRKYRFNAIVTNMTTGIVSANILNGTESIRQVDIFSAGKHNVEVTFSSPTTSGVRIAFDQVASGVFIIENTSLTESSYYKALEFGSNATNKIINGSFEDGVSGWTYINSGSTTLAWDYDNPLFGFKTPIITSASGAGFNQAVTATANAKTLSAYLNVISGVVDIRVSGNAAGIVVSGANNGWQRYSQYYATATANPNIQILAKTANTSYMIDGVQYEQGKVLTAYNDINKDGSTARVGQMLTYNASGINTSQGTIRFWYTPSFMDGDSDTYTNGGKNLFVWVNPSTPTNGYWQLYYDPAVSGIALETSGVGGLSRVGFVEMGLTARHLTKHIVMTWSGTTSDIWIDGVKAYPSATTYPNQTFRIPTVLPTNFYVGGHPSQNTRSADGTIDSFMIDTRKWSAPEIQADVYAYEADVPKSFKILGAKLKKANKVINSNFAERASMSSITGWTIVTSGMTISGTPTQQLFGDVSIELGTT